MFSHYANAARKEAPSFWDQSRESLISARDMAYKKARELAKQSEALYPQIRSRLPDPAVLNRKAQAKAQALYNQARASAHDTSSSISCGFRKAESWTIRLGIGYMLMKLFNSRKTQLNEINDKVTAHINERPIESAAIALGVGYLLAKILR